MFQAQRIKQVGVGPNRENFNKKFHKQSKLGWGPNREFQQEILQAKQVGVGPQQRERNKHCELYYELQ